MKGDICSADTADLQSSGSLLSHLVEESGSRKDPSAALQRQGSGANS